jgi:hypothetical protein
MPSYKERIIQATLWLLPTSVELVVYLFLSIVTLSLSNSSTLRELFFISPDFDLISAVLQSISDLVQLAVGDQLAAPLSLAIFWALVGMVVYIFIWVGGNFSTELSNDLALTKYIHPRGVDPRSPLRDLISKTIFRFVMVIILIFYTNITTRVLIPLWISRYRIVLEEWPRHLRMRTVIMTLLGQMLTLHLFIVITRLIFLKKRVIDV